MARIYLTVLYSFDGFFFSSFSFCSSTHHKTQSHHEGENKNFRRVSPRNDDDDDDKDVLSEIQEEVDQTRLDRM